jgi:ADP-L-glycero-D-manno-heptose 6-epimerase
MFVQTPILLTGAAGFIGAQFASVCNRLDWPIISVDAPEYFRVRTEHSGLTFGETVDRETLFDWLEIKKPTLRAIVHLGACTDTTELNVTYLTRMNLDYSKRLWEWATQKEIPFIYASSAATFGAGELGYSDEEENLALLHPLNPYAVSKHEFDLWALGQEAASQAPPFWSGYKFFNVYGFGERHKNQMASVVLHAFDQIHRTGKVRLFKSYRSDIPDGFQIRDFISVEDVTNVLKFALLKPIPRGIYNLGTGKGRTYLDLARAVFRSLGVNENVEFIEMPIELRNRYQYFTQAEMGRLRTQGYPLPFLSLEDGVAQYVKTLTHFSKNPQEAWK